MAGTVIVTTAAVHTYQRRFTTEELQRALGAANLYIVSRRPRTVLSGIGGSAFGATELRVNVGSESGNLHRIAVPAPLKGIQADASGTYFRAAIEGREVHGEVWALATVLTAGTADFCRHEVIYVGRAEDVNSRLYKHPTLQGIYEEHAHSDWDIFVTPLVIEETLTLFDDHILDNDTSGDFELLVGKFGQRAAGRASTTTIATAEHAMISYFKPSYNALLKDWDGRRQTEHFDVMRRSGVRLVIVHVQGAFELARFFTKAAKESRTHVIMAEVPSSRNYAGFGAVASDQAPPSTGSAGYDLMLGSNASLKDLYDSSAVILTTFGPTPVDRMPSDAAWPS